MSGYQQLQSPFDDPSVRSATAVGEQAQLDYNPFDANTTQSYQASDTRSSPVNLQSNGQDGRTPGVVSGTNVHVESERDDDQSSARRITTEELERRQKELDLRAAEIERRERELLQQGSKATRQPNWPPFPSCCFVKPWFYQDFDVDIAPSYRMTVKLGYGLWIAHAVAYVLNVIGGFCYFFGSHYSTLSGTSFGLCILFAVLFIPASLFLWYRPLYRAFRDDSSISFFIFFLVMFAQFATCIVWTIGIPGWGSAGFITALTTLSFNLGCGIVMVICAVVWSVLSACDVVFLLHVHRLYRTTGASFERAREELKSQNGQDPGRSFTEGMIQSAFGTFNRTKPPPADNGLPR